MGLNWPGIQMVYGDMSDEVKESTKAVVDEFADRALGMLTAAGYPPHASPIWRPWNFILLRDAQKLVVAFSRLEGGSAGLWWIDRPSESHPPDAVTQLARDQLGQQVSAVVVLPRPEHAEREALVTLATVAHLREVEREQVLGRLGDLPGVGHLEPSLRQFLKAHPEPERNVFVMMRFLKSQQLDEIYAAVKAALGTRGFHAVRADDRDYTGELWSNIEVYMTCCKYGVAVFEDIERRDFNPNVSLELGYMLGRRKRCLILKEQRLPELPADVIHRLYKPFDVFEIAASVRREVGRWVEVDLGVTT